MKLSWEFSDTKAILEGSRCTVRRGRYNLGPDQYIEAVAHLYFDIILIIAYILCADDEENGENDDEVEDEEAEEENECEED